MLDIIKVALWGGKAPSVPVTREVYEELKHHALIALPAPILKELMMPEDLREEWIAEILRHVSFSVQYEYQQSHLPLGVGYIILKGTSAAQYYPYPKYRTMGDIDILTRREDFNTAIQQLMEAGFCVVKDLDREVSLKKNGIIIELHRRFASLNDPDQAKYLDDILFENITSSHILPDLINGLVLLEHISQHLEHGLGLRQIIDWMMFVDKCLSDKTWPVFRTMAERIGLDQLAMVTTRMCEMYLGLSHREWCASAPLSLCGQLMDFVLSCGNFGKKMTSDTDKSENIIAHISTPKMFFKYLQRQGMNSWDAPKRYRILRPFAWLFQAIRYTTKGLKRDHPFVMFKKEYRAARRRNAMLEALGVKLSAKGIAIYKDGKYVKE